MSHIIGTVQTLATPLGIGPNTGGPPTSANTWAHNFAHTAAPVGTKLLLLHFQNVSLPAGHRLEVDLGYDTDVFTSASGASFWTRPINIYVFASGLVPIRYVSNGSGTGGVELDWYGRGERHAGESEWVTGGKPNREKHEYGHSGWKGDWRSQDRRQR